MKKNESSRKPHVLKLNRETIVNLEQSRLRAVAGGEVAVPSVKFCTELCPTETCPADTTAC